jgi:hypothetical protein
MVLLHVLDAVRRHIASRCQITEIFAAHHLGTTIWNFQGTLDEAHRHRLLHRDLLAKIIRCFEMQTFKSLFNRRPMF